MIKKQLKSAAVLPLFLLFICIGNFSAQAEEVLSRKNIFGLSYGAYTLQTASKSIASVGMVQMQFRRALNEDLSVEAAFMNGVSFVGGFNSLFWGFDLGGSYALGSGFPSSQKVSDIATIFENKKFGVFVGGGLATRVLPLATGTFTYSGTYIHAQPQYYINENTEIHARGQFGMLVNGGTKLYTASVIFGIGMAF